MMTFTQFLEAIKDKIGPYSGDPLQAMAVNDISQEDDLPYHDVAGYYFEEAVKILKEIETELSKERMWGYSDLKNAVENLKDHLENKKYRLYMSLVRVQINRLYYSYREAKDHLNEKLVGLFGKLSNCLRMLLKKPVRASLARYGASVDFDLSKLLKTFKRLVQEAMRTGFFDGGTWVKTLERFIANPKSAEPEELLHVLYYAATDLGRSIGGVANLENENSRSFQLFKRAMAVPEFWGMVSPNIGAIMQKINSKLSGGR